MLFLNLLQNIHVIVVNLLNHVQIRQEFRNAGGTQQDLQNAGFTVFVHHAKTLAERIVLLCHLGFRLG